jgi:hypothetical protein
MLAAAPAPFPRSHLPVATRVLQGAGQSSSPSSLDKRRKKKAAQADSRGPRASSVCSPHPHTIGASTRVPTKRLAICGNSSGTVRPAQLRGALLGASIAQCMHVVVAVARTGFLEKELCKIVFVNRYSFRSTCGAQWRGPTRRTPPWRSTSAERWTARPEWSRQSRQSTCAPGAQ